MKIIKYLFLIAILLSIGLSVFVSTQTAHFNVCRSKIIKTPRAEIYNYVNDFKNWENFITTTTKIKKTNFSKKTSELGSKISFTEKTGETYYINVFNSKNAVITFLKTSNGAQSKVNWIFKDTIGGTKVIIKNEGSVDLKTKISWFFQGGITKKIENQTELCLEKLNKTIQYEVSTFEIKVNGIVIQDSTYYIKRAITCYEKDVQNNIKIVLPQLQIYCNQKNIKPSGKPFIEYQKSNSESTIVQLSVCIPVKDSVFTAPNGVFKFASLQKYSGLKGTLKGNYTHITKLWTALRLEINNKQINTNKIGRYFEIYKTNKTQTPSQTSWITEIIIPLEIPKPKYSGIKRRYDLDTQQSTDLNSTETNPIPTNEATPKIN